MLGFLRKTLKSISSTSRKERKSQRPIRIERLEDRCLFVVGATYIPTALPPDQYDGVVNLNHRNAAGSVFAGCSGSLLSTGKHILTAAHCLTDDNGVINSASTVVKFRLAGRDVPLVVPASRYTIHPDWRPNDGRGSDIAILELPEIAPADADRYDLYRNTNEVDQIVQIVGYGWTGRERASIAPDGNRRMARNTVEGASYSPLFGPDAGPDGTVLWYDFDGTLGGWEGMAARGDSGGPMLIGSSIVGVTSGCHETSLFGGNPEFEMGEDSSVMRVSHFATWIDSVTARGQSISLNMNNQPTGNDGNNDWIQVYESRGQMQVMIGSNLVASLPASSVRSVFLTGSLDNDTFHFLNYFGILGSVNGGSGGSDTLKAASTGNRWLISGANRGSLNSSILFDSIENLAGGEGIDRYNVQSIGAISGTISGGASSNNDLLDYSALTSGVSVNLLQGTASRVTGGIRNIRHINGSQGADQLRGNNESNTIQGFRGVDTIFGSGGDDWLFGGDDGDRLFGEGGVDRLFGGEGSDRLDGGFDGYADYLYGEGGLDTFVAHLVGRWKIVDGKLTYVREFENDVTDASPLQIFSEPVEVVQWDISLVLVK